MYSFERLVPCVSLRFQLYSTPEITLSASRVLPIFIYTEAITMNRRHRSSDRLSPARVLKQPCSHPHLPDLQTDCFHSDYSLGELVPGNQGLRRPLSGQISARCVGREMLPPAVRSGNPSLSAHIDCFSFNIHTVISVHTRFDGQDPASNRALWTSATQVALKI